MFGKQSWLARLWLVITKCQMTIIIYEDSFSWNLLDLSIFDLLLCSTKTNDMIQLRKINLILRSCSIDRVLILNSFFLNTTFSQRLIIQVIQEQIREIFPRKRCAIFILSNLLNGHGCIWGTTVILLWNRCPFGIEL